MPRCDSDHAHIQNGIYMAKHAFIALSRATIKGNCKVHNYLLMDFKKCMFVTENGNTMPTFLGLSECVRIHFTRKVRKKAEK